MFQQATKAFLKISTGTVLAVLLPCTPSPVLAQGGSNDTPFVGQLMYIGFNHPPKGWAFCNGQLLPIAQYSALFSLLGTFYGGNGVNNFALPNMQGRAPVGMGQGAGQFELLYQGPGRRQSRDSDPERLANLPAHAHSLSLSAQIPASSAAATSSAPSGNALANTVHSLSYSAAALNGRHRAARSPSAAIPL